MTPGCTCSPRYQRWEVDGTCSCCGNVVREVQIMDRVKAVLITDRACWIDRNEIGHNAYFPDGTKRKGRIKYGVGNPGGADLIGFYGPRFLAVEVKTVIGEQSKEQIAFERAVLARSGVYALVRSEADARALLAWLRAGGVGQLPEQLRGGGSLQATQSTTT